MKLKVAAVFTAVASAAYEKACVMFSIGAMQTQVANSQDMRTDDGLKLAAKLLQVSCCRHIARVN